MFRAPKTTDCCPHSPYKTPFVNPLIAPLSKPLAVVIEPCSNQKLPVRGLEEIIKGDM